MIKGHHSLLLRRLFSTPKDNKNCQRLKILNKTKISPTPCFTNEKYRQNCACKRRRKDIDKIIMKLPLSTTVAPDPDAD